MNRFQAVLGLLALTFAPRLFASGTFNVSIITIAPSYGEERAFAPTLGIEVKPAENDDSCDSCDSETLFSGVPGKFLQIYLNLALQALDFFQSSGALPDALSTPGGIAGNVAHSASFVADLTTSNQDPELATMLRESLATLREGDSAVFRTVRDHESGRLLPHKTVTNQGNKDTPLVPYEDTSVYWFDPNTSSLKKLNTGNPDSLFPHGLGFELASYRDQLIGYAGLFDDLFLWKQVRVLESIIALLKQTLKTLGTTNQKALVRDEHKIFYRDIGINRIRLSGILCSDLVKQLDHLILNEASKANSTESIDSLLRLTKLNRRMLLDLISLTKSEQDLQTEWLPKPIPLSFIRRLRRQLSYYFVVIRQRENHSQWLSTIVDFIDDNQRQHGSIMQYQPIRNFYSWAWYRRHESPSFKEEEFERSVNYFLNLLHGQEVKLSKTLLWNHSSPLMGSP